MLDQGLPLLVEEGEGRAPAGVEALIIADTRSTLVEVAVAGVVKGFLISFDAVEGRGFEALVVKVQVFSLTCFLYNFFLENPASHLEHTKRWAAMWYFLICSQ